MRIDEKPGSATGSEQRLTGIGVSPGIAIGAAYIGDRGELPVSESRIAKSAVENERARFADAVSVSVKQLRKLKTRATALPGSAAEEIGFLLDALQYGAPPHGGIALGLDRVVMILRNTTNIRDVIAFPKTQSGADLMCGAPSPIDEKQLREAHVKINAPPPKTA